MENSEHIVRLAASTAPIVAKPKMFLFAPPMLALISDAATGLLALVLTLNGLMPPFILLTPLVVHAVYVFITMRDPHLDTLVRARIGTRHAPTANPRILKRHPRARSGLTP